MNQFEPKLKTVLVFHFDSGETATVDVDNPDIEEYTAAGSFLESGLLKNSHLWINNLIILSHKIEYIEFKRIPVPMEGDPWKLRGPG